MTASRNDYQENGYCKMEFFFFFFAERVSTVSGRECVMSYLKEVVRQIFKFEIVPEWI